MSKSNKKTFKLVESDDVNRSLKLGIWLYIFLLIFEGGIRKWVLPSLSTPLLLVRDPIALWLIIKSYNKGIFKPDRYCIWFIIIGIVSFIIALLAGHHSIVVAAYGARTMLIYLPFIFVIGSVFNRDDVVKVGYVLLLILIPMTLLSIAQFYSPQSSWVNRGVGGDEEGAGFGGALGFFRPPGTFSFTNGLSLFYGLCSSYLFYFLYNKNIIPRWLLISGLIATLLSIPFSISRTVFFQNALCFAFSLLIVARKPKNVVRLLIILGLLALLLFFLSSSSFVQTGFDAFSSRFESASESEGGLKGTLIDRVFKTMLDAIFNADQQNVWGRGIGSDTNVGIKILGVQVNEHISDYEWARTILELGPIIGLAFIGLRTMLTWRLLRASIKRIKINDYLPWMLLSFGIMQLLQGQIAQPTSLGFVTLSGGLIIASFKMNKVKSL